MLSRSAVSTTAILAIALSFVRHGGGRPRARETGSAEAPLETSKRVQEEVKIETSAQRDTAPGPTRSSSEHQDSDRTLVLFHQYINEQHERTRNNDKQRR